MVRLARVRDIPDIITMLERFYHSEMVDKSIEYDKHELDYNMRVMIRNGFSVILVSEASGILKGTLAGMIDIPWFSSPYQKFLIEKWWWVEPEYRAGSVGPRLLNTFIKWGRDHGACKIQMTALNSKSGQKVVQFYKSMGFKQLETSYIKDI